MKTNTQVASPPDPTVTRPELRRAAWSSWLGSSLEYMDFTLYAFRLGLRPLFFNETPAVALISSLGVYGSGFVVRPIGGYVFGRVGDKHGRRIVLIVTLSMMASRPWASASSDYAQIGIWAPALLVLLRLVQGFGAGAELAGPRCYWLNRRPCVAVGSSGRSLRWGQTAEYSWPQCYGLYSHFAR